MRLPAILILGKKQCCFCAVSFAFCSWSTRLDHFHFHLFGTACLVTRPWAKMIHTIVTTHNIQKYHVRCTKYSQCIADVVPKKCSQRKHNTKHDERYHAEEKRFAEKHVRPAWHLFSIYYTHFFCCGPRNIRVHFKKSYGLSCALQQSLIKILRKCSLNDFK